jgi:hypothetical protein
VTAARVLLETPVTFDVPGDTVHCPMVRATVGGTDTLLILDSGSTDHVLTIDLATRARLPTEADEPGVDHAGDAVPSWKVGSADITIGGVTLGLRDVMAIAGPPPFEGWGVGGFLSPQHLHPDAWVVIDLANDSLAILMGDAESVRAWIDGRVPSFRVLTLPRENDPTVAVRACIEPYDAVPTMLNTGGDTTEFALAAVPGLRGTAAIDTGLGLSGADVVGDVVDGCTLEIGGLRLPLESVLVRERMPHPPGIIGMDVLRSGILGVSADLADPVLLALPIPR